MRTLLRCLAAAWVVVCLDAEIRQIDPPAGAQSGMPFLTNGPDGAVYLSWIDPLNDKQHALRFARWTGSGWSQPETAAQGLNWFVNWGDFPSLAVLPDGTMLAHWLTKNQVGGKYGYGIRVARRDAATRQWNEIHGMSLQEQEDYAGFLTFVPNQAAAVYLAPPADGGHGSHGEQHSHRKTVRFVSFTAAGKLISDKELDADACSCCQTAVGKTRGGLIAAYRDHLPGEIRDISVVRFADGAWTQPRVLHPDGWKINGCPTDGPAMSSADRNVAITWLTRAEDVPKIQVTLSTDEGRTFGPPQGVDGGNPAGRPAITAYGSGYLIVWLEKTSASEAEIRARRMAPDGTLYPAFFVATASSGRATGFPKVAVSGDQVLFAWRAERVRAALLTKKEIEEKEKQ
ncbi:MAG: hypothetical protein U0R19_33240 [Bryobacteraceae bacterium]